MVERETAALGRQDLESIRQGAGTSKRHGAEGGRAGMGVGRREEMDRRRRRRARRGWGAAVACRRARGYEELAVVQ